MRGHAPEGHLSIDAASHIELHGGSGPMCLNLRDVLVGPCLLNACIPMPGHIAAGLTWACNRLQVSIEQAQQTLLSVSSCSIEAYSSSSITRAQCR